MVEFIRVDVRGLTPVVNSFKRVNKFPELLSDTMLRWGKTLEKDMKNSAKQSGIKPFTGELLYGKGIEWRQRPKGKIGMLFIRQYGVMLDSMRPHYVAFKPTRTKLIRWGLRADSATIRAKARRGAAGATHGRSIHVKPHPFINMGWNRARSKLLPMIKKDLTKAVGG